MTLDPFAAMLVLLVVALVSAALGGLFAFGWGIAYERRRLRRSLPARLDIYRTADDHPAWPETRGMRRL